MSPNTYLTRKQQGPLIKLMSRMLKPKTRSVLKSSMKKQKNKHQVHFY